MRPLLMLRIGYMERYDGPDTITGGGAYIRERGVGGEVFNFKPSRGACYGYAMSLHGAGLNLAFLDDRQSWREGDELGDVDVVFFARRPGIGQVVVGWYRGATVYHKQYLTRRGSIPGMNETERHFLCKVDASKAVLLPEDKRTFAIPYAPKDGKGFPGQSNVWYPEIKQQPEVVSLIQRLRKYIAATSGDRLPEDESGHASGGKKGGRRRQPDQAMNALVEAAAVQAVYKFYERQGYTVETVERENLGWDLVVAKGRKSLKVEVKGISAPDIYFELTPNEYAKLKEHAKDYRVCVVCDALSKPRIYELTPQALEKAGGWQLFSSEDNALVKLRERVAAIGVEIAQGELA